MDADKFHEKTAGLSLLVSIGRYGGFQFGVGRYGVRVVLGWVSIFLATVDLDHILDLYITNKIQE